jgi:hypothetical protein
MKVTGDRARRQCCSTGRHADLFTVPRSTVYGYLNRPPTSRESAHNARRRPAAILFTVPGSTVYGDLNRPATDVS